MELTPYEKIIKAKIQLQEKQPFYSHLSIYIKPKEKKEVGTMGVNKKGELYFNPEFVDKLTEEELLGVFAHEIQHIALQHPFRTKGKEQIIWNIATDLVVNYLLDKNDFTLPKGALLPKKDYYEDEYEWVFQHQKGNLKIKNIEKKTADKIYREIINELEKNGLYEEVKKYYLSLKARGGLLSEGTEMDKEQEEELKKEWIERTTEAYTYAKSQGKEPAGFKRFAEMIVKTRINWKTLLYRYITKELPKDYTYNHPSKRSRAIGIYLPSISKEGLKVYVGIDTSGSISKEELSEFKGQINAIAKSFSNINFTIVETDSEIQDKYKLTEKTIKKFLNKKVKGGGGTSFIPFFEEAEKDKARLCVFLTDGYGDFPEKKPRQQTIWVNTKEGIKPEDYPYGKVIQLKWKWRVI